MKAMKPEKKSKPGKLLEDWLLAAHDATTSPRDALFDEGLTGGEGLYGIEWQTGLSYMAGNRKLYRDLLLKFATGYANFGDRLKAVLKEGDRDAAGRMIHTLKGLAGSLGMTRLRTQSEQVEGQIRRGIMSEFSRPLQLLTAELARVVDSIRKSISADDRPVVEKNGMVKLRELERALIEHNPEAVRHMKEIGDVRGYEQELGRLRSAVTSYEFAEALEVLKKIKITGDVFRPGQS